MTKPSRVDRTPTPWVAVAAIGAVLLVSGVAGIACVSPGEHHVAVHGGDCATCHLEEAALVLEPPHDKFGNDCGNCHENDNWSPAKFGDHDKFFPLHGKHAAQACRSCHAKGYASGDTPKECVDCHQKDYDNSPFPGHSEFATTCADCHGDEGWKPATIPDHDKFFVVDGAHTKVRCASCHTRGYDPGVTPKQCVGCHQKDYDTSPYPGHQDFPTTCADCHTTKAWTPASGGAHPESRFPIEAGAHKVVECMECHDASLGPNGKDNTDCVQCHKRSKWDAEHHEVRNYPAGPAPMNFCLDCHKSGRGGD